MTGLTELADDKRPPMSPQVRVCTAVFMLYHLTAAFIVLRHCLSLCVCVFTAFTAPALAVPLPSSVFFFVPPLPIGAFPRVFSPHRRHFVWLNRHSRSVRVCMSLCRCVRSESIDKGVLHRDARHFRDDLQVEWAGAASFSLVMPLCPHRPDWRTLGWASGSCGFSTSRSVDGTFRCLSLTFAALSRSLNASAAGP